MIQNVCLILLTFSSVSSTDQLVDNSTKVVDRSEVDNKSELQDTLRAWIVPDIEVGPYTLYPRNWAYQALNLVLEWVAFLVHTILIQLLFP